MPVDSQRSTSGGKGNQGMFIERDPRICAAGLPTAQPDDHLGDFLQHYLLKDEVDSLLSDVLIPPPPPRPLPPLRRPIPLDMRNAGFFGQVASLINPPNKSKFQAVLDDLKETTYASYWKKSLGQVQDPTPMLPEGFDIIGTTFGKKTPYHGRLYDIVMPKDPIPDKTPRSKLAGFQTDRKYCRPAFDPDLTYGYRSFIDKRGTYGKCCLTDDRVKLGTANKTIVNTIQANFEDAHQPRIGEVLAPYGNIDNVPKGYSFGILKSPDNLPECLTYCEINTEKDFFRKCLTHLNSLRKSLSKRFLPAFFRTLYLTLKFFDKEKSGWLPKQIIYNFCGTKHIRFDPSLIEPLLSMWNALDGTNIDYKIFVLVINYKEPSPEIPKIQDIPPKCLDFRTTYGEMVRPGQKADNRGMAGLPSGRYFDMDYPVTPENCCKSIRECLPHESDMKACLAPSAFTLLQVNHRHMYAKREPHVVKRVFEATGEKFSEEKFNKVWEEAKKYHSEGWVCYETFRRALEKL